MFKPAPAGDAGFSVETLQALRLYFDTLVASGEFPGVVALLVRGEQLLMNRRSRLRRHRD